MESSTQTINALFIIAQKKSDTNIHVFLQKSYSASREPILTLCTLESASPRPPKHPAPLTLQISHIVVLELLEVSRRLELVSDLLEAIACKNPERQSQVRGVPTNRPRHEHLVPEARRGRMLALVAHQP